MHCYAASKAKHTFDTPKTRTPRHDSLVHFCSSVRSDEGRIGYLRPPNEVRRFHANFTYQAASWSKPRRVIAKVEWHPGELYPRLGFIVTNNERMKLQTLSSLKEKLIKIGAKVISHGRSIAIQMAEVAIPRQMFQEILRLIAELRPKPPPAPA
jgi:Transposase DDE domain group 1